ncbi:Lrp/AsnC family transcriptional regulator [Pengzhenrongella sp.]|uniref:Lrp/AsnC family transcriptional regulator n=1 Tax=Pengzhenrongella sp. TaxID=2888820 RepID=UPI002F924712
MMRSTPWSQVQRLMFLTFTKRTTSAPSVVCYDSKDGRCARTIARARHFVQQIAQVDVRGCTVCVMQRLDELDCRLIAELRADGRVPVSTLARILGVTRATVNSRLKRLLDSGTVLGFSVRVHDERDPDAIRAIALIEVEGRSTDQAIRHLRGFPEVRALHTTNGGWDLVAELRTDTLSNFDHLLARIRSVEGVVNSETSVLLSSAM